MYTDVTMWCFGSKKYWDVLSSEMATIENDEVHLLPLFKSSTLARFEAAEVVQNYPVWLWKTYCKAPKLAHNWLFQKMHKEGQAAWMLRSPAAIKMPGCSPESCKNLTASFTPSPHKNHKTHKTNMDKCMQPIASHTWTQCKCDTKETVHCSNGGSRLRGNAPNLMRIVTCEDTMLCNWTLAWECSLAAISNTRRWIYKWQVKALEAGICSTSCSERTALSISSLSQTQNLADSQSLHCIIGTYVGQSWTNVNSTFLNTRNSSNQMHQTRLSEWVAKLLCHSTPEALSRLFLVCFCHGLCMGWLQITTACRIHTVSTWIMSVTFFNFIILAKTSLYTACNSW